MAMGNNSSSSTRTAHQFLCGQFAKPQLRGTFDYLPLARWNSSLPSGIESDYAPAGRIESTRSFAEFGGKSLARGFRLPTALRLCGARFKNLIRVLCAEESADGFATGEPLASDKQDFELCPANSLPPPTVKRAAVRVPRNQGTTSFNTPSEDGADSAAPLVHRLPYPSPFDHHLTNGLQHQRAEGIDRREPIQITQPTRASLQAVNFGSFLAVLPVVLSGVTHECQNEFVDRQTGVSPEVVSTKPQSHSRE